MNTLNNFVQISKREERKYHILPHLQRDFKRLHPQEEVAGGMLQRSSINLSIGEEFSLLSSDAISCLLVVFARICLNCSGEFLNILNPIDFQIQTVTQDTAIHVGK